MSTLRAITLCFLTAGCLLQAAEKRLQVGPTDLWGRISLLSQYVDEGAARTGDAATQAHVTGRYYNVGAHLDVVLSLDNDRSRDLDAGDPVELRGRIDYLIEIPDYIQVIPYLQASTYPSWDGVEDPVWLGADTWYLLPVEGMEAGLNVQYDLEDNYGYRASLGLREFYQQAPLDLSLWQLIHFGDEDYHAFVGGSPSSEGITTVELGAETIVPLPWVGTWLSAGLEAHWWAKSSDRSARGGDSLETMFYVGFDMRLE